MIKNNIGFFLVLGLFASSCLLMIYRPIPGALMFLIGVPLSLIFAIGTEKPISREVKQE